MSDPLDVRPDHMGEIRAILRRHLPSGVQVFAFGSRAAWTAREFSDLDLALEGCGPVAAEILLDLAIAFEESGLPWTVDVVDMHALKPAFRAIVEKQRVPLAWEESGKSEWPIIRIEKIAKKIAMGPFGSNIKVETFVPIGVPIISGKHLHNSRLDENPGYNFITKKHAENLCNSNVFPNDIIFTHAGTIGQVSLIPETSNYDRYVISQRQFYLRVDPAKADPAFVTRWFHSPTGKHRLLMHASQVGVPSISRPVSNLKAIEIELPPLHEQRAISKIFDALDDKIELNRRMNATLEAMARGIFTDWFVDFGPVRAKMAGREPYLAPELWSLFPDTLDNTGKPEGWEIIPLSETVSVTKGRSYKSSELEPSETALVTLKSFERGGGYREGGLKPYIGKFKPEQVVKAGEIVMAQTDVTQAAEIIGRPAIIHTDSNFRNLVASLDVLIIRPHDPHSLSHEFLFQTLASERFRFHALAYATGTTVLHLAKNAVPNFDVITPNAELIERYSEIAKPLNATKHQNFHESRTLAETRDFLLPKLMSGEIRLRDAEKTLQAME